MKASARTASSVKNLLGDKYFYASLQVLLVITRRLRRVLIVQAALADYQGANMTKTEIIDFAVAVGAISATMVAAYAAIAGAIL